MWLFLLGERDRPPGEFSHDTIHCPPQCVLLAALVEVILWQHVQEKAEISA